MQRWNRRAALQRAWWWWCLRAAISANNAAATNECVTLQNIAACVVCFACFWAASTIDCDCVRVGSQRLDSPKSNQAMDTTRYAKATSKPRPCLPAAIPRSRTRVAAGRARAVSLDEVSDRPVDDLVWETRPSTAPSIDDPRLRRGGPVRRGRGRGLLRQCSRRRRRRHLPAGREVKGVEALVLTEAPAFVSSRCLSQRRQVPRHARPRLRGPRRLLAVGVLFDAV